MADRDRSSGWQHAKLTGHENEELVCGLLKADSLAQKRLKVAAKISDADFVDCACGGLHETRIPSVMGNTTKNKSDITAQFSNGEAIGVSVKKSLDGQVYLIKDENFMRGMERQYQITIPPEVKRAIKLFWGPASDAVEIIEKFSEDPKIKAYELRKRRLTADTLRNYDKTLYEALLNWFKENIYNITDFCFSRGLALNPEHRAGVVWYKNMVGEHNIDDMLNIDDLCEKVEGAKDVITYGTKGGGTVINLPFGFVQWHQKSMQFHHRYECIEKLFQPNKNLVG